ncbi:FkbM family methyltransferase [Saliphagus sp. LR7]|uniref:FkbM family methyltransferase n=1 Tax=Saliphagus sp. LR7 TaxID=2282654 RepID=UPI000DF7B4DF|nr:FkbM family methyltransferase [Saliphagus sp. LR7]
MGAAYLERALDRAGLLEPTSRAYNSVLRYRNGATLATEVGGLTARFYTESAPEYAHVRNFWMDDLGGERAVLERFLADLVPEDVVYDVGANVGTYTCFAQQVVTEGQVHAFEPHPENAARLADNVRETGDRGVTRIHRVAVSSDSGRISLAVGGGVVGKGTHNVLDNGESSIPVEAERLDTCIEEHGLRRPDVLKIDVEGAEDRVLEGAEETLEGARLVYVEVHPQHGVSLNGVESRLEDAGFAIEPMEVRGSQPFLRASRSGE